MYQAKSGVKNFSLYWGGEVPRQKIFFSSLNMYQAKSGVKIFPFTETRYPPLDLRPGPPLDLRLGTPPPRPETGTPPTWTWDGVPLCPRMDWGPPRIQGCFRYPPYLDLRWGTPPSKNGSGTPPPRPRLDQVPPIPPPSRCELTKKLKTVPSPILRMRAVTIQPHKYYCVCYAKQNRSGTHGYVDPLAPLFIAFSLLKITQKGRQKR